MIYPDEENFTSVASMLGKSQLPYSPTPYLDVLFFGVGNGIKNCEIVQPTM